jgi:hypothetical protein
VGITYGCKQLEPSEEASGVVHWVRIDLTAPGIVPYVTSKDPVAVSQGWQYRLRRVEDVVASEHLAVAINGTLFSSKSSWWRMPGDLANAAESVVADHTISHGWLDTYLPWFDDQLTPHLRPDKATEAELAMARWGIGGEDFWLRDGRVWPGDYRSHIPDGRTAVAVDLPRKLLFLAVGTHISPTLMYQTLADLGARDGMLLDGGDSSSMAIGTGARHRVWLATGRKPILELKPSLCGDDCGSIASHPPTEHRPWLAALLARRPTKVAAIALANKIARMT